MDVFIAELMAMRDLMSQHGLFSTGMLLILGYFLGKLVSRIHLPKSQDILSPVSFWAMPFSVLFTIG